MSTKLWYSMIGHLATCWLSPFSGVARACACAHMIFTAVFQKRRGKLGRNVSFNESHVLYLDELYFKVTQSRIKILQ